MHSESSATEPLTEQAPDPLPHLSPAPVAPLGVGSRSSFSPLPGLTAPQATAAGPPPPPQLGLSVPELPWVPPRLSCFFTCPPHPAQESSLPSSISRSVTGPSPLELTLPTGALITPSLLALAAPACAAAVPQFSCFGHEGRSSRQRSDASSVSSELCDFRHVI